ncbi:hypothetical protein X975_25525, partial [Stegodyphus mimosarum]
YILFRFKKRQGKRRHSQQIQLVTHYHPSYFSISTTCTVFNHLLEGKHAR